MQYQKPKRRMIEVPDWIARLVPRLLQLEKQGVSRAVLDLQAHEIVEKVDTKRERLEPFGSAQDQDASLGQVDIGNTSAVDSG